MENFIKSLLKIDVIIKVCRIRLDYSIIRGTNVPEKKIIIL